MYSVAVQWYIGTVVRQADYRGSPSVVTVVEWTTCKPDMLTLREGRDS